MIISGVWMLQVWGEGVGTAHAVEPSDAMRWLGMQIERQLHEEAAVAAAPSQESGAEPENSGFEGRPGDESYSQPPSQALSARSIRWLQHLQGFSNRKSSAGGRHGRRTIWQQSTGACPSVTNHGSTGLCTCVV